ncbi:hypothetical protein G6F68_010925 [Rhizopus microsporus]|nr:hypothetical protein G6F68_010925 [Rhizopus microsporus]
MNDERFPWLVLVPRLAGVTEWIELDGEQQDKLRTELNRACKALKGADGVEKINIGALGNIVRQLHFHVIGRHDGDPAWPGPVWGSGPAHRYEPISGPLLSLRRPDAIQPRCRHPADPDRPVHACQQPRLDAPEPVQAAADLVAGGAGGRRHRHAVRAEHGSAPQTAHRHQVRGRVTPVWPWYLPPRSLYDVSQTSSDAAWKNSIWATPALA